MKVGIICPSEIALRRFMPALQKFSEIEFVGLAIFSKEERYGQEDMIDEAIEAEYQKAKVFIEQYGGKIYKSYMSICASDEVDILYIPLPPALHYKWAEVALNHGKHVLVEKPCTICVEDTKRLVSLAQRKQLALHENYMFAFHNQLEALEEIIHSGVIGDVRLYRINFGFPRRAKNDFRYNKALGGGALIDAGGYVIKYAAKILGSTAKVKYAQLNYVDEFDVDIYGSGAMVNEDGITVQVAYGMDNSYKCELEVWGSTGYLSTGRVLTAPVGFEPSVIIRKGEEEEVRKLPEDDSFYKSIAFLLSCINNVDVREANYLSLVQQAELVDQFIKKTEC